MKVVHLSVECYPVAKVGGLADVIGALPKYQRKLGIDACVIMPWYNKPYTQSHALEKIYEGNFYQGAQLLSYTVFYQDDHDLGFPLYLIFIPGLLDRDEVYGYDDEADQWIAFQHAVLDWMVKNNIKPDLINCHDHHVGLIPFLLQYGSDFKDLSSVKTLFTIHNGQYQGWMSWNRGVFLPPFDTWKWGLLDWDGVINPLSSAVRCCDAYSTVSEGYLSELTHEAKGLENLFIDTKDKGFGIVNGIDTDVWNPATDPFINHHYDLNSAFEEKLKIKKNFCLKYNIPSDGMLISYIGRFAYEKGADILAPVLDNLNSNFENKLTIFILGSGDPQIQSEIQRLKDEYSNNIAVYFGYNETLAHEVYAASDMILMPSRVEPCGLNQLYALKYGTIPLVRAIGGLKDTVIDVSHENGYGFVFNNFSTEEIVETINRAINFSKDREEWSRIVKRAMMLDFSWEKSAQKYIDLYNQLLK